MLPNFGRKFLEDPFSYQCIHDSVTGINQPPSSTSTNFDAYLLIPMVQIIIISPMVSMIVVPMVELCLSFQ
jgi:hypothetical protein